MGAVFYFPTTKQQRGDTALLCLPPLKQWCSEQRVNLRALGHRCRNEPHMRRCSFACVFFFCFFFKIKRKINAVCWLRACESVCSSVCVAGPAARREERQRRSGGRRTNLRMRLSSFLWKMMYFKINLSSFFMQVFFQVHFQVCKQRLGYENPHYLVAKSLHDIIRLLKKWCSGLRHVYSYSLPLSSLAVFKAWAQVFTSASASSGLWPCVIVSIESLTAL